MTSTDPITRIDEPDFKAGAWTPTTILGEPWDVCECFELIEGRWEGFVAIRKARTVIADPSR